MHFGGEFRLVRSVETNHCVVENDDVCDVVRIDDRKMEFLTAWKRFDRNKEVVAEDFNVRGTCACINRENKVVVKRTRLISISNEKSVESRVFGDIMLEGTLTPATLESVIFTREMLVNRMMAPWTSTGFRL
jgi:hypothetical protein